MKNKKIFQRLMGIGCAALMSVSLIGCGGDPDLGVDDKFGWKEDENFTAMDVDEWSPTFESPYGGDSTLKIGHWMLDSFKGDANTESSIYPTLKEAAKGLDLEAWLLGDDSKWTELSTAYMSRSLPDMFVSMGPEDASTYREYIKKGAIIPVSDFVDSEHYPNLYNHIRNYDYLRANLPYAEGKLWSVPVKWQMEHTMYVRLDWIQNLNNKIEEVLTKEGRNPSSMSVQEINDAKFTPTGPVDMLEFYRLAWAFTYCDPDNNGNYTDTYGYTSGSKSDLFNNCWIFEAFGAGYDRMVDIDGDGVYEPFYSNENTKKALAFINKMYSEGLIHSRFDSMSDGDKEDAFASGEVGMIEGQCRYNTILKKFMSSNNIAIPTELEIENYSKKIGMFNPPVGEDGKGGINGNPNFWTVICLSGAMDSEELDAALSLLDYLYSDEGQNLIVNGVEGTHYNSVGQILNSETGRLEGWKKSLESASGVACINCIANITSSYLSCHQDNYALIVAQMEKAKEYAVFEDYAFLQPESYVKYWNTMKNYAQSEFKSLIKSEKIVSSADIKNPSYEDLYDLANNSSFTDAWGKLVNKLNTTYRLSTIEKDYNSAISNGAMKVTKADIGMAD